MAIMLSDLVNLQNGTAYDANALRCALLDERGNQFILVKDFGTESPAVISLFDKGSGLSVQFLHGGVQTPLIDMTTGLQRSLYDGNGALRAFDGQPYTLVNVENWTPISGNLPAQFIGYLIHWNSLVVSPPLTPSQNEHGYEAALGLTRASVTEDYRSIRPHTKVQAKKFTITFGVSTQTPLHVQAIRLLKMNPDGSLVYINDDDAQYAVIPGDAISNGTAASLYTGNSDLMFNAIKRMQTHGIDISYPNLTTVSAFEVVVKGKTDGVTLPTNMTLTFVGADGKEHPAGKVTGFEFNGAVDEEQVLRLKLHDSPDDPIDAGINLKATSDSTAVKAKIRTKTPITLQEFLTQWMPTMEARPLAALASQGKTAAEIAVALPNMATRYINIAVSAKLLMAGMTP
ncbi:hypothetical protein CCP4SC76_7690002 [Gammaproteobacteria bacterium]